MKNAFYGVVASMVLFGGNAFGQTGSIEIVTSITAWSALSVKPTSKTFTFNTGGGFFLDGVGGSVTQTTLTPIDENDVSATTGPIEINPGSGYSVAEADPTVDGWALISAHCDSDASSSISNIVVSPGEDVVCTFVNAPLDSDGDGFDDNSDNCTLTYNPGQRDTDADGYGNFCDPDFNNDGETNLLDLSFMRPHFFTNDPDADLNGDDGVNIIDLGILKSSFFETPGPTGTDPERPNCNCLFSSDCAGGNFCNYGPSGFTVEDICLWRVPIPPILPGTGCSVEADLTTGQYNFNVCDGYCTAFGFGSSIGIERADVVIVGVGLWADALLQPSVAGGGPVDTSAAQSAKNLEYFDDSTAMKLGRHVADLLSMASGLGFNDYFNDYEINPNESGKFVDIENSDCRINSARLAIKALQSEMREGGSGAGHVLAIPDHCKSEVWQGLFAPRCESGPAALECFSDVVADMAVFLSTPRQTEPAPARTILDSLGFTH